MKKTEMNPAPLFRRFAAFFVDWYMVSLCCVVPVIIMQSIYGKDLIIMNSLEELPLGMAWIGGISALLIYVIYYCILPLKTSKKRKAGQTPGRYLMKIQVVPHTGEELTFKNFFTREILSFLLLQGYLTSANIYIIVLLERTAGIYITPYVQSFYYVTCIISVGLLLIGKRKQMLQDRISHTFMANINS